MKRMAALAGGTAAAIAVSGFALSGTALASTGGWGPSQGGQFSCAAPVKQPNWSSFKRHHHKISACVTFSVDNGSYFFTEDSGPQLQPGDGLFYQGQIFTVATINGPGGTFTVTSNGTPYCDDGDSISDGVALLVDSYDYGYGWGQGGVVSNG